MSSNPSIPDFVLAMFKSATDVQHERAYLRRQANADETTIGTSYETHVSADTVPAPSVMKSNNTAQQPKMKWVHLSGLKQHLKAEHQQKQERTMHPNAPLIDLEPERVTEESTNEAEDTQNWYDFSFHASRWGGLWKAGLREFFFPKTIFLTDEGIKTRQTLSMLMPWRKEDEIIAFRRVSSVRHIQGMLWDSIIIESIGGTNTLDIDGVRKPQCEVIVAAINKKL